MAQCLIGCGSNTGQRRQQLDRAIELLRFMPGITLLNVSHLRETRPIGGPVGQPSFLNGACLIETDLCPHDVMEMLTAVENTLHRERDQRWGPRTIDLDLLLYEDIVLEAESLSLPHPRMSTRRFVLEPCVEIAPDVKHPQTGCTLREMLDNICSPHLHVAIAGVPGAGAPEVAAALADATLARLVHAPAQLPPINSLSALTVNGERELENEWRKALVACAQPLAVADWPADPHGTVTDYWLTTVALAAAEVLPPQALDRFHSDFSPIAADTVAPHVVILLTTTAAVLEERMAFCARQAALHTDIFTDLAALCVSTNRGTMNDTKAIDVVAALMRLQKRLVGCLRPQQKISTVESFRPKSVVMLDSSDIAQAALDAVAAVEAMA